MYVWTGHRGEGGRGRQRRVRRLWRLVTDPGGERVEEELDDEQQVRQTGAGLSLSDND